MLTIKTEEIQSKIKKVLSEKRYEHSLGVAYTAYFLAVRYGEDPCRARLAGILHDCAKQLGDEKTIELCKKNKISISEVERNNPFLLHGKVGALIAEKKFKIQDKDILNAITYHTTGRPGMSLLEKIIYIADYIEPNRNQAPNLELIRKLAFDDLDLCLLKILESTINYINDKESELDPVTVETYNYYFKESLNNGE